MLLRYIGANNPLVFRSIHSVLNILYSSCASFSRLIRKEAAVSQWSIWFCKMVVMLEKISLSQFVRLFHLFLCGCYSILCGLNILCWVLGYLKKKKNYFKKVEESRSYICCVMVKKTPSLYSMFIIWWSSYQTNLNLGWADWTSQEFSSPKNVLVEKHFLILKEGQTCHPST